MTIQEVKQRAARVDVWTNMMGVSLDKFFGTVWTRDLKFKEWTVKVPNVLRPEDRVFRFTIKTNSGNVYVIDLPTVSFTEVHGSVKVVFISDENNEIIYAATEQQAVGELGAVYYQLTSGPSKKVEYYECTFIVKENPVLVNGALLQLPMGQNRLSMYVTSLADVESMISRNIYSELIIKPVIK